MEHRISVSDKCNINLFANHTNSTCIQTNIPTRMFYSMDSLFFFFCSSVCNYDDAINYSFAFPLVSIYTTTTIVLVMNWYLVLAVQFICVGPSNFAWLKIPLQPFSNINRAHKFVMMQSAKLFAARPFYYFFSPLMDFRPTMQSHRLMEKTCIHCTFSITIWIASRYFAIWLCVVGPGWERTLIYVTVVMLQMKTIPGNSGVKPNIITRFVYQQRVKLRFFDMHGNCFSFLPLFSPRLFLVFIFVFEWNVIQVNQLKVNMYHKPREGNQSRDMTLTEYSSR